MHTGEWSQRSCRSLAPQIAEAERSGLSALSETEARTLRRLLERLATS